MFLITGSRGQLGSELAKLLPEAVLTDVDTLDITNAQAVFDFVYQNNIDTIINCAAYTAVDKAEDDEEKAYAINVVGPKNLAQSGAKIIHVSTDYVFDGCGHKPYTPDDAPHPISVYGRTKLAGETEILKHAQTAVVIRTAWLYSPYGGNFVKTMLTLGRTKDEIRVVADQIGTPTYAPHLAEAILHLLPRLKKGEKNLYHFTDEGVASWYDLAYYAVRQAGLKAHVWPIATCEYPTKAVRPAFSVLNKSRIKKEFDF